MRMIEGLRQAKHQTFLVSKKVRRAVAAAALHDADRRGARHEEKRPFTYTENKFPQPLTLRHQSHFWFTDRLRSQLEDYR